MQMTGSPLNHASHSIIVDLLSSSVSVRFKIRCHIVLPRSDLYDLLARCRRRAGCAAITSLCSSSRPAVAAWRERVKADPRTAEEDEGLPNNLGYRVMGRDTGSALEVLRLVATVFPDSSNAHDSLGEAYMVAGDEPHAIAEYEQMRRTLDADPRVPATARAARRTYAEQQLAKLRAP
jgi:hypothetical protein